MLISFSFFSSLYEKKFKSNYLILLIGFLLFVPCIFVFNLVGNDAVNTIAFIIVNILFSIICYEIPFKFSVVYSILLTAIMWLAELITLFALSALLNIPTKSKMEVGFLFLNVIVGKVFYLLCTQFFAAIFKKSKHHTTESKHFIPLLIFSFIIIVISVSTALISYEYDLRKSAKIIVSIISIVFLLSTIFIYIYYQKLLENEQKINELESEKRLYNLNNTYMDVLEHQNDELHMIFHDTKNHYMALNSFDNIEDVKQYISKIYPQLESKRSVIVSNNKMLDLILAKYAVVCEKNNIKFDCEVKTANLDYIDDSELCVILNNLLDNAVEAAVNSKQRLIELSLRHINNMDMLSVINSCDSEPKHNKDKLLTTKFDSDAHGYGTKIIKKHAKKNNGKYEWFYDKDEHKFHSTILFQK